jgi:NADPH:quinone reductase-like Zn-dependent oxidoreductase
MRVIEVREFGGPEVLVEVERPEPEPGPGQVAVRVRAAAVNPVDWFTRSGALAAVFPHPAPPLVLGWDLAGTVERDGGGFTAGQRVAGMVPWFTVGRGTYAEVVVAEPEWLAPVPDGVDDVTAGALPLNALTARQALDLTAVPAGATLLVTGASGAVGGYAVQLAAAAGVEVLAVASDGDEEWVTGLGAKHVLARAGADDLAAAVRAVVAGGVDAVLDAAPVGPGLVAAVRDGGAFTAVLDATAPAAERGVRVAKVSVVPDAAALRELLAAAAAGALSVRVAGTRPLAGAAGAHERAAAGGLRGKLVLVP